MDQHPDRRPQRHLCSVFGCVSDLWKQYQCSERRFLLEPSGGVLPNHAVHGQSLQYVSYRDQQVRFFCYRILSVSDGSIYHRFASLERVVAYTEIEQEPKPTERGKPPAAWPTSGDIKVENLFARYSKSGPAVLHDLAFNVRGGERVGVVGRTGSGKVNHQPSNERAHGANILVELPYSGVAAVHFHRGLCLLRWARHERN